jgi:hypothetical protein
MSDWTVSTFDWTGSTSDWTVSTFDWTGSTSDWTGSTSDWTVSTFDWTGSTSDWTGIDVRLDGLDGRVQALEARALDTKPIWERALAEILEVRKGVEDLDRKFDVLTLDVMQIRADQRRVEERMDELETRLQ